MTYLALYRAWRPRQFKEVVGQEQTVSALRNAVIGGKIVHAYLFAGPRGTGKTSMAKIVAKAVNCENLKDDGEPCNLCSSCLDINNGNFMDVIEIDAASNRGIDEIRDLKEKVQILPAQGKYKVYIIDEVHMLTSEAFNALLKTIEEPPESVIFILATTEPQRIPATIQSRCQIYNFRRLTMGEIITRLQEVATSQDIKLEDEAAGLIARRANGGLRDALSILDQIASYKGHHILKADVLDVLGLVDQDFLIKLMEAVIAQDTASMVSLLNMALNEGKEARQIAREMSFYLRDLLMYINVGEGIDFLVINQDDISFLDNQQAQVDQDQLLTALQIMMETVESLRFSEGQRFLLEMGFLELAQAFRPVSQSEIARVKDRADVAAEKVPTSKARSEQAEAREILWQKILSKVREEKVSTHALLAQGYLLGAKDNVVYIGFRTGFKFHKERMQERANMEILENVLEEIFNHHVEVEIIFIDDNHYNDIIVKKAIEYFGEDIVEVKD